MKITSFDNAQYNALRTRILQTLKPLSDEFGVDFDIEGGRLSPVKMQMKFVVGVRDTASGQGIAEREFRKWAPLIGLTPDDFGKTFTHAGRHYKVNGLKLGAPKFNVLAERVPDGAGYKFTAEMVRNSLKTKIAA